MNFIYTFLFFLFLFLTNPILFCSGQITNFQEKLDYWVNKLHLEQGIITGESFNRNAPNYAPKLVNPHLYNVVFSYKTAATLFTWSFDYASYDIDKAKSDEMHQDLGVQIGVTAFNMNSQVSGYLFNGTGYINPAQLGTDSGLFDVTDDNFLLHKKYGGYFQIYEVYFIQSTVLPYTPSIDIPQPKKIGINVTDFKRIPFQFLQIYEAVDVLPQYKYDFYTFNKLLFNVDLRESVEYEELNMMLFEKLLVQRLKIVLPPKEMTFYKRYHQALYPLLRFVKEFKTIPFLLAYETLVPNTIYKNFFSYDDESEENHESKNNEENEHQNYKTEDKKELFHAVSIIGTSDYLEKIRSEILFHSIALNDVLIRDIAELLVGFFRTIPIDVAQEEIDRDINITVKEILLENSLSHSIYIDDFVKEILLILRSSDTYTCVQYHVVELNRMDQIYPLKYTDIYGHLHVRINSTHALKVYRTICHQETMDDNYNTALCMTDKFSFIPLGHWAHFTLGGWYEPLAVLVFSKNIKVKNEYRNHISMVSLEYCKERQSIYALDPKSRNISNTSYSNQYSYAIAQFSCHFDSQRCASLTTYYKQSGLELNPTLYKSEDPNTVHYPNSFSQMSIPITIYTISTVLLNVTTITIFCILMYYYYKRKPFYPVDQKMESELQCD